MIRIFTLILALLCALPLVAEEKEGGIIGTGVIGQITGLDQIEVSGMQFAFAPDVELKGVRGVDDLRMGMTVALATGRDGATWRIDTLQHMPLLTGPVTAPGEVMGVAVTGPVPASGVVQVDGFWTGAGIVASRVAEMSEGPVEVTGVYDGRGRVGLVSVRGAALGQVEGGQTVTVRGRYVDGAVEADTVMAGPFMGAAPQLVLLEGFYQPEPETGALTLQGVAVARAEAERDVPMDQLVRRCALNGRTDFERSALTPEAQEVVNSFCVSAAN